MSDVTIAQIFGEVLPTKLTDNADARSVNAIYQFNLDGDDGGTWSVDLTKDADHVSEGETEGANCTINMKSGDFINLWTGKLPAPQAYMMGKLKIKGDMGLAMKLQKFIG